MSNRLRVYAFDAQMSFEGWLAGAVERVADRLLDTLFVLRDAGTGEVQALDLATATADGTFIRALDFRLDPARRGAATQAASAPAVEAVAGALKPGAAALALVLAEGPDEVLDDAVARTGGRLVADLATSATRLADLVPELRAALAG